MKTLKNFLMLALMPLMVLALAAGCKKSEGPVDDPHDGPIGPNVTKDAVINIEKTEVAVGLAAGTAYINYTITNPHADAKISAETTADWISNFDTTVADKIRFDYTANNSDTKREAVVTLKYLYAEDVTFVVSQATGVGGTFTFENLDVTSDYFSYAVDVIPSDPTMPYIVMSASPDYIEAYELQSDEALFNDDYEYFEYIGSFYGMSALEVMMKRAKVGNTRGIRATDAIPGEDYVFYAYYFDPSSGARASAISRYELTAGHPDYAKNNVEFSFDYEINGPDVFTQVDPVGYEGDYYFDVMTAEELAAAEKAGYTKEEYFVKWWAYIVAGLVSEDYSTSDIIAQNTCWGENLNTWNYELMANSDYYVFAFTLEENALCNSTPKYEKLTTGDAVMSDNQLSVYATNVTSRAATFTILTTIPEDRYSFSWATAAEWKSYGSNDVERVNNLLKQYVFDVYRGDKTLSVTDLEADTEYVLYAFGNHGGVATTAPAVVEFKTVSDAPGVATIALKDLGYYDSQDLIYLPGWSFLESDYYSGMAILPIELDVQPANHGAYFYEVYDWEGRNDEYNDQQYIDGLLYQIGKHGSMTTNYTYQPLLFNNRYVIVAIVVDANGQYSPLYKKEVYCTYNGVNTDIEAFANWWDAMQSGGALSSVFSVKPMQQKVERSNVKMSEKPAIVRENKVVEADVVPATRF